MAVRLLGLLAAFNVQLDQRVAFLQAVAQLELDGFDLAGLGRGDLHARLVRLEYRQGLFGFYLIAFLDQNFNDLAFTAEVGHLDEFTHGVLLSSPAGWFWRGRYRMP